MKLLYENQISRGLIGQEAEKTQSIFINLFYIIERNSEPSQKSKTELFEKIVNNLMPLTFFKKGLFLILRASELSSLSS